MTLSSLSTSASDSVPQRNSSTSVQPIEQTASGTSGGRPLDDGRVSTVSLEEVPKSTERPTLKQEAAIFLSTFLTVFVAEMGDKTQLTTLLMSAESNAPWVVFAGAAVALVATSFLGVTVGCWLARQIPPKTLERMTGILLLLIAASLFWDVFQ